MDTQLKGRTRPRGFAPWSPREGTLVIIEQIKAVLREYVTYLPLTVRQIFYRLVGAHNFPKTERDYGRLIEYVGRARRARLIPMGAIRDDGGQRLGGPGWSSARAYIEFLVSEAPDLVFDRTVGQNSRLVVACEAVGMAPQLESVVGRFGIEVVSSGGFDSITERHRFAREVIEDDRPTEVLHIGDHDPSGEHVFSAFAEDVKTYVSQEGEAGTVRLPAVADGASKGNGPALLQRHIDVSGRSHRAR
jgi:hypothetical protein